MDESRKPRSRQKKVVNEGRGVEKYGEGLGTGPVGSTGSHTGQQQAGSARPASAPRQTGTPQSQPSPFTQSRPQQTGSARPMNSPGSTQRPQSNPFGQARPQGQQNPFGQTRPQGQQNPFTQSRPQQSGSAPAPAKRFRPAQQRKPAGRRRGRRQADPDHHRGPHAAGRRREPQRPFRRTDGRRKGYAPARRKSLRIYLILFLVRIHLLAPGQPAGRGYRFLRIIRILHAGQPAGRKHDEQLLNRHQQH